MLLTCLNGGMSLFYWLAVSITIFSTFVKFNSGVANLALLFIFNIIAIFARRDKIFQYVAGIIAVPILFLVAWLIYNPSFSELYFYIKGASEISTGYISAMSVSFYVPFIPMVLGYTCIFIYLIKKFAYSGFFESKNFASVGIFLMPVFMALKHLLFVRHMMIIPSLSIYLSLFILFMPSDLHIANTKRKRMYYFIAFIFLISSLGLNKFHYKPATLAILVNNPFTNPYVRFYEDVKSINTANEIIDGRELKLNDEFKSTIKNRTYSTYPFELSYSFDSPKNFRTMPVFQAYSAYTPWLDIENAKFFANDDTAPQFIVLNLDFD